VIDGPLRPAGAQEVREHLRELLDFVRAGTAVAILQHGGIVAVMLDADEVERCWHVEHALSTVHGLEIYPEAARDTSEIAALIRNPGATPSFVVSEIWLRPHEILAPRATTGPSEFRHELSRYLEDIVGGQPYTLIRDGRFAVTVVSNREYQRLGKLRRMMRWFEAAGLDLAKANPPEILKWVRDFQARAIDQTSFEDADGPGTSLQSTEEGRHRTAG
jgi:antitoxin (DNA-binding transcriptional repressor) of toxin-antitoxin stability system